MDENTARELYWQVVYKLREIIESGYETKEEILEELDNDLES